MDNMKISKIANGAEYRIVGQFQNLLIFGISIISQIKREMEIPKVSDLENSKNF